MADRGGASVEYGRQCWARTLEEAYEMVGPHGSDHFVGALRHSVGVPVCVAGRTRSPMRRRAGRFPSLRIPLHIRSANYSCGAVILRGVGVD